MKHIGAHVSISGGIENAPLNASKLEAKAFAMFTKAIWRQFGGNLGTSIEILIAATGKKL